MTLTALLACVDEAAAQVLRRVLDELSIRVESCPDFARAAMRLAQDRFDLVIADGKSNSEVITLLRDSRLSRVNDSTLAIAVVSGQERIHEMFSLGVNFVLYKPVAYDRALSSVRAARTVMRKEKRKNARAAVHAQATVEYANVQQEKATLVDLAQDGMQVRFGKKIPPTGKIYFQFMLPGQSASVRLSGQLMWQDWNGRAGVQFVDVPKTSRRMLTDFLRANLPSDSRRERFSDVTVEMEEPLQMSMVGTGRNVSQRSEPPAHEVQPAREGAAAVEIAVDLPTRDNRPDHDNRRAQTRYTCRLGAEIYRAGTSVPNHGSLTDLSSGGCYLEVPLPLPCGCPIEIVVRTQEMKLQLRGTVLASHPGYGMGVAFELKTKKERENVQKLTDLVAAYKPSH